MALCLPKGIMIDGLKSNWRILKCTPSITNNLNTFVFLVIDASHGFFGLFFCLFPRQNGEFWRNGHISFHVKSVICSLLSGYTVSTSVLCKQAATGASVFCTDHSFSPPDPAFCWIYKSFLHRLNTSTFSQLCNWMQMIRVCRLGCISDAEPFKRSPLHLYCCGCCSSAGCEQQKANRAVSEVWCVASPALPTVRHWGVTTEMPNISSCLRARQSITQHCLPWTMSFAQ